MFHNLSDIKAKLSTNDPLIFLAIGRTMNELEKNNHFIYHITQSNYSKIMISDAGLKILENEINTLLLSYKKKAVE